MSGRGCLRRASSSRRSRYNSSLKIWKYHSDYGAIFIFGAQASDVFGDPDEIDASINISEQRKKKLKSEVGNETDDLHRLRRYCDERLESNKRSVGIPLKSGLLS